jgi:hypothetical protein
MSINASHAPARTPKDKPPIPCDVLDPPARTVARTAARTAARTWRRVLFPFSQPACILRRPSSPCAGLCTLAPAPCVSPHPKLTAPETCQPAGQTQAHRRRRRRHTAAVESGHTVLRRAPSCRPALCPFLCCGLVRPRRQTEQGPRTKPSVGCIQVPTAAETGQRRYRMHGLPSHPSPVVCACAASSLSLPLRLGQVQLRHSCLGGQAAPSSAAAATRLLALLHAAPRSGSTARH